MSQVLLKVSAVWDPDAGVWYISESDVPGLATEAETIEALNKKLMVMIPELLILNGVLKKSDNDHLEVPYELMTRQFQMARAGC